MRHLNGWAGGGLAACLLALGAGSAVAQEVQQRTENRSQAGGVGTTSSTQVRRVSVVIGATIQFQGGAGSGKIEDVIINDNGCIEYVIVAYEDRFAVVPWSVTTVNFEQRTVSVNVTQEKIREVTFTRDSWQTISDPQFIQRVRTVFGVAPRREGPGAAPDQPRTQPDRPGAAPDRPQTQPDRPRPDQPRPPQTQPDRPRPPQNPPQADPNRRPPDNREQPRRPDDPPRQPPPPPSPPPP